MEAPKSISVPMQDKSGEAVAYLRGLPGGYATNTEIRRFLVREARKNGWEVVQEAERPT